MPEWTSVLPGGLSGGSANPVPNYFSETFTATGTYTVNHNLGRRPLVQVIDTNGEVNLTAIDHTDANTLVVAFAGTLTDARVVCIA